MACRTKEDFTALATAVADSLIAKHGASKFFAGFVDDLARALAEPMKSDEVGKVRATLAGLAIDKQKAEKSGGGKGGPKGKPTAQVVARGREDLSSFGEVLDDDVAAADFNEDEDFVRLPAPLLSPTPPSHAVPAASLTLVFPRRCRCEVSCLYPHLTPSRFIVGTCLAAIHNFLPTSLGGFVSANGTPDLTDMLCTYGAGRELEVRQVTTYGAAQRGGLKFSQLLVTKVVRPYCSLCWAF